LAKILGRFNRIGKSLLLAAVFFNAPLCGAAQAMELKPMMAQQVKLGPISAMAYYTIEKNGFRIVTTIQPDETVEGEDFDPLPVRFIVTLAAGQEVRISVPCEVGIKPIELKIARSGDEVEIGLQSDQDVMAKGH
jgi:hypothetical protein